MNFSQINKVNILKRKYAKYILYFGFFGFSYLGYINFFKNEIDTIYKRNEINDIIMNEFFKIKKFKYCHSALFFNRYIDFVYSKRSKIYTHHNKKEININDDKINLIWSDIHPLFENKENLPICVLFPNFIDNYDSYYINSIKNHLNYNGFISVIIDPIKEYDKNEKLDIYFESIKKIKETHKNSNIYFVGFSFGSNLSNKIIEKYNNILNIKSSINICPITDLEDYLYNIEKWNLKYIKRDLIKKWNNEIDYKQKIKNNFYDIDFENINIPNLNIFSRNDPLVKIIPENKLINNENNFTLITPKGSHLNFFISLQIKQFFNNYCSKFIEIIEKNN